MTFSAEQLRLLEISDQVEDKLSRAELNRLQSAESVRRRIARIGIDEFKRIKREQRQRWLARSQSNQRNA